MRSFFRTFLPLSLLAVSSVGCTNAVVDAPRAARAASASSDALSGSCAAACGGQSADGCYCDDLCESYGDCCDDYQSACVEPESNACFDDSQCAAGEFCLAEDTQGCCPPNALCSFDIAPCQGQCTAPVICPAFIPTCDEGEEPADVNGNGCIDGCAPIAEIECFDDSVCPEGQACVALDNTETCCPPNALCSMDIPPCAGVCEVVTIACPEIWPVCGNNEEPADTNGDGCIDGCAPTEPVQCQVDADCADGYCEHFATCMAIGCPAPPPPMCIFPNCDDGTIPACKLAAMPECDDDEVLAIKNSCFACVDARTCEVEEELPEGQCNTDADCGANEECQAVQCITAPCPPGFCQEMELEEGFCNDDSDCDGNEHCQPIQCVTTPCPPGICEVNECPPILCNVGTEPADTTGDGCYDDCVSTSPSCESHCGGQAEEGCWCDDYCSFYGDCCGDIEEVCQ